MTIGARLAAAIRRCASEDSADVKSTITAPGAASAARSSPTLTPEAGRPARTPGVFADGRVAARFDRAGDAHARVLGRERDDAPAHAPGGAADHDVDCVGVT